MSSCFNPDINVYIYNIAKSQRSDGQGGLTDIGDTRTYPFNKSAKQKFGDLSISKTQEGIIKPTNYSYKIESKFSPPQQFNFKFSNNKVDDDGCVYSSDILTTLPQQVGGSQGDIKLLYKFYKHHKTKLSNTAEFLNNVTNPYYTTERIEKIITLASNVRSRMKSYYPLPNNLPDIVNRIKGSIIYNFNVTGQDKLIIFGDFHGLFHSFFRIFIRLHIMGVIDFPNYIINEGYKIIFLGDILDRGLFSLEIMYILFKFILNNTTAGNLQNAKIIINRGNHEEPSTYKKESFKKEVDYKLGSQSNEFLDQFNTYLSYCPSAIILNYQCECNNNIRHKMFYPNINVNLNCNKKYWLSHGGIPLDGANTIKLSDESYFFINSIKTINKPAKGAKPAYTMDMNTIRWFDYITSDGIDVRGPITVEELLKFMNLNNIDFCIRGHTDDNENAFLLSTSIKNTGNPIGYSNTFPLNNKIIQEHNQGNEKVIFPNNAEYVNNPIIPTITQIPGFIAKIKTDGWYDFSSFNHTMHDSSIGNPAKYNLRRPRTFTDNNVTVYPVLTISTNSDNGRSLNNDSFIVFNFTNGPDFTYNFNSTILSNMNILASNTYNL